MAQHNILAPANGNENCFRHGRLAGLFQGDAGLAAFLGSGDELPVPCPGSSDTIGCPLSPYCFAPHSGQNLVPASNSALHFLHAFLACSFTPHSGQNLLPCALAPHSGQ